MRTLPSGITRRVFQLAVLCGLALWSVPTSRAGGPHDHAPLVKVTDDDTDGPICKRCRSEGRKPCSQHEKGECALDDEVIFCSELANCATCGGYLEKLGAREGDFAEKPVVALGKQSSMSSVMQKQTTELTPAEHALAFSCIDYLMQKDGRALNKLLIQLRERTDTRDALQDTFGTSILEFEELWKAWVLATYPTR